MGVNVVGCCVKRQRDGKKQYQVEDGPKDPENDETDYKNSSHTINLKLGKAKNFVINKL